jgi:hypothetical protein
MCGRNCDLQLISVRVPLLTVDAADDILPVSAAEYRQPEADESEDHRDDKRVTAVLMRVEDNETARIGRDSHECKDRQSGPRRPISPTLMLAHWNDCDDDAEQRHRAAQGDGPRRRVLREQCDRQLLVRASVRWRGQRRVREQPVRDGQKQGAIASHDRTTAL